MSLADKVAKAEARKERRKILKSLDAAREGLFPHKTCGASRHVHMIVEGLLDADTDLARSLTGFEPEHMAGSIASVLENLWQARRWMKWEKLPPTPRHPYNGHWVPDFDALDVLRAKDATDGEWAGTRDRRSETTVSAP